MATVTTTIAAQFKAFTLEGGGLPGNPLSVWEADIDGTVSASGAGDNQRILIQADLPSSYAYVMVALMLRIVGATAATQIGFNASLGASWSDREAPFNWGELVSEGEGARGATGVRERIYRLVGPFSKFPVVPRESGGSWVSPRLEIDAYNTVANDQQYFVRGTARFLQIGRDKIQNAGWHSPDLTR